MKRLAGEGHVASLGKGREVYKCLVGKPGGKKQHGRRSCRLENGNKMVVRETTWEVVEWIHLAQDGDLWLTFVKTTMNLLVLVPRS
jgi:hypothetical protein